MTIQLDRDLSDRIKALSQANDATLFMTLLGAFNVLLYRYAQQTDICIGTPVANRHQKEIESLVGFFINTLVLRNQLDPEQGFEQLLRQIKQNTLNAFARQEVPFEQIVDSGSRESQLESTIPCFK